MTREEIVDVVRTNFAKGPPNGWLLGWDQNRHFALISAVAAPHKITNYTSFDYNFCNWYEVKFESDDSYYWLLTIKISHIVPVYIMHWTYYNSDESVTVAPKGPANFESVEQNIRYHLICDGYFEMPVEWYAQEVYGIAPELSDTNDVTLGKCLFRSPNFTGRAGGTSRP